jgi:choline dehydrogenase-like flavoprotein
MKHYDVIVVGAPSGGQTAADDLNRKRLTVALAVALTTPKGDNHDNG